MCAQVSFRVWRKYYANHKSVLSRQVLREFGVNLLHYLAAADSAMSRTIALQSPCISLLVAFIEQAEQNALGKIPNLSSRDMCEGQSIQILST